MNLFLSSIIPSTLASVSCCPQQYHCDFVAESGLGNLFPAREKRTAPPSELKFFFLSFETETLVALTL